MTELPSITPEDFEKKDISELPVARGKAPKGVTDRMRSASAAELQLKVWQAYVGGCTDYRMLEEKTGVPRSTAHRWIQGDLKRLASEREDLAENFLEVELQRLDTILDLLMRDVGRKLIDVTVSEVVGGITLTDEKGEESKVGGKVANRKDTHLIERVDVDIVDRILKVQAQREKLLGLNAPKKEDKDDDSAFDLDALCKAALLLQKGEMPEEFVDVEFTVTKEDDNEEKETGDKEESSLDKNSEREEAEEPGEASDGREEAQAEQAHQDEVSEEEIFIIEDSDVEGITKPQQAETDKPGGETLGFDESFFKDFRNEDK